MGEGSLEALLQGAGTFSLLSDGGDMSNMSNSSSSTSPEERHSNTPGSDQDGDEGRTGMKKKEKNREAARKSRKKHTERADQLHQDLESLESSNSALRKEIHSLRKEALLYTAALRRHEPFCVLQGPSAGALSAPCPSPASAPAPSTSSGSSGGCSPLTPAAAASPPPPPPPPESSFLHLAAEPDTNPGLFLSQLTVPSPPWGAQTPTGATPSSLGDPTRDLSFLELLEVNDWILQERNADATSEQ